MKWKYSPVQDFIFESTLHQFPKLQRGYLPTFQITTCDASQAQHPERWYGSARCPGWPGFWTALLHCLTQGTRTGHPKHDTLRNHEIDEHGISENYICIILQIDWQVLVKDTLRLILI